MSKTQLRIAVLLICLILATIPMTVCAKPYAINHHRIITESDNGKMIFLKKGDIVYLRLEENPSTGYSWNLSMSEGLRLISDEYKPNSSKELIVGSGGIHLWKIKTTSRGKQQIEGIYKRSWEQETGTEQTFKLKIMVI